MPCDRNGIRGGGGSVLLVCPKYPNLSDDIFLVSALHGGGLKYGTIPFASIGEKHRNRGLS